MVQYLHPGVYIQEVPSTQSVTGVPTSVPVFIGVAASGPTMSPTLLDGWDSYTRTFGGFIWNRYLAYAVYGFFSEGGTSCYVINVGVDSGTPGAPGTAKVGSITFNGSSPGSWANSLQIQIANDAVTSSSTPSPTFLVRVLTPVPTSSSGGSGGTTPPMSDQVMAAFIAQNGIKVLSDPSAGNFYILEQFSGFSASDLATDGTVPSKFEQRINANSMFIRAKVASGATRPPNGFNPLAAGSDATYLYDPTIDLIEKIQGISLAAIPDTVTLATNADQMAVMNYLLLTAENLTSFFAALDPPYGMNVQGILGFKQGTDSGGTGNALNSTYGALYYPWIWIVNPLNALQIIIPPSGPSLGRYAYGDSTVGVWKAPAGTTTGSLQLATAVAVPITDSDQDSLNPAGIDAIRSLIGYGICVFGARTLSSDSNWIYINVRRLFIYIEQSIANSLQWVVFEPNTTKLWGLVTREVSSFLTSLWQQGALFGATASDAFFVTCDGSNNSSETITQGQLIVDIGVAAVRPAEFVVLRFTQKALVTSSS